MTGVLIIEGDLEIANQLEEMIRQNGGDFQIWGIIHSIIDARHWLMNNRIPQLIFCDIQLADGLGFEIFQDLPFTVPVIFCTANKEYALEAFEHSGIDYLLKPIDNARLNKSLKKFEQLKELLREETPRFNKRPNGEMSHISGYKSSLLVYFQNKIIPINVDQLDFIYSNNYQVTVHTQNAQYEARESLNNIIITLNPRDFFRANRQFIIHRKAVTSIQQYFGRKLLIDTSSPTPEPVIISKANATDFLKWIEGVNSE